MLEEATSLCHYAERLRVECQNYYIDKGNEIRHNLAVEDYLRINVLLQFVEALTKQIKSSLETK